MANANQVIVNGETILDLRSDTVTPETLQKGYTAHDKSGTKITGTLEASSVSVQPSKSVTITSNGTVSVTPDTPYDALSSVDVTVNVASGGGGENETCIITLEGEIPIGGFIAFTFLMPTPFAGDVIKPEIVYFTEGFSDVVEFEVLKNHAFYMGGINEGCETKGSIVDSYADQNGYYSFLVTGDCRIAVW